MILWLKPVIKYEAKTEWSSEGGVSQKSEERKFQMEPVNKWVQSTTTFLDKCSLTPFHIRSIMQ